MNFRSRTRGTRFAIVLLHVFACSSLSFAQAHDSFPHKLDQFEELRTSDVKPRLENFAIELNRLKDHRGYIIGYRPENWQRGTFLRTLHGYKTYLVNAVGVLADRISVVDVEGKQWLTELWLVPEGASPPHLKTISPVAAETLVHFDSFWIGPGCEGQYTLVLEDPKDTLSFFAEALRTHAPAKAYIVMHPSTRGPLREADRLAAATKQALINKYGIPANRIITNISSPRRCLQMNYWLVQPKTTIPGAADPELVFHSSLISEAEQMTYTVRRVAFVGNERTRDNLLRGRIPGLQEGEIFTRAILQQSLQSLSRFRRIRPVGLKDVEVSLSRDEKLIDLYIHVNERR